MSGNLRSTRNGRLILWLTLLGAVCVIIFLPYYATTIADRLDEIQAVPAPVIYTIFVVQTTVMVLIASWLGLSAASRVGLDAPWLRALAYGTRRPAWSGKWLLLAIGVSLAGSLLIAALQIGVFAPHMPELAKDAEPIAWWRRLLTMFYGGVVEELLVRLGLMSVLVWIGSKLLRKRGDAIPPAVYGIAIVLASLLFGAGHLPAASLAADGLTGPIIAWVFIGNGLLGLWFGWLYWKRGLEYAIVAHMSADLWLHAVIGPLLS